MSTSLFNTHTQTHRTSVLNSDQIRSDFTHNTNVVESVRICFKLMALPAFSVDFDIMLRTVKCLNKCCVWGQPSVPAPNPKPLDAVCPQRRTSVEGFMWFTADIYWSEGELRVLWRLGGPVQCMKHSERLAFSVKPTDQVKPRESYDPLLKSTAVMKGRRRFKEGLLGLERQLSHWFCKNRESTTQSF